MPSPPIALFMTTIASQQALRKRQEYILRILQVKKIPYTAYDLASDEEAKRLWKRKSPTDKQQLPGILVGGKYPGTFEEFEDAVEHDELDIFLRLKDTWDSAIDEDRPAPVAKPVGVPGASSPLQMTPDRLKSKMMARPPPSPLKGKVLPVNKRVGEFDVGDELSGYGLQGVKVTDDELRDLVAELGLNGDEAGDLVKGLSDAAGTPPKQAAPSNTVDEAGDLVKGLGDAATLPKQAAPSNTVLDEAGDLVKGLGDAATPPKQAEPSNTVDEAGDLVKGLGDAATLPKQAAPSNTVDETVTKESLDLNSSKLEAEKT